MFALGRLRTERARPDPIDSVGIVTCSAIGDTILASAIARDLKCANPKIRTVAFISPASRGITRLVEGFDEEVVLHVTRPLVAIETFRRSRTDVLIDITPWPRAIPIFIALSPARFTVGFRTDGESRHWAFDRAVQHSAEQHEVQNYRALLSPLGIRGGQLPRPPIDLRTMSKQSSAAAPSIIVFHPWASGFRSDLREWPTDRWAKLARKVIAAGYRVAITGGPGDLPRAKQLWEAIKCDGFVEVLAGKSSLAETAEVLARAAAVVSVNTGVMHLAAALERPMVALHGPTNPARWGPLSSAAAVVGPGRQQGGAYLNLGHEYPRSPPDCMGLITVEEVQDRLWSVLAAAPGFATDRVLASTPS